MSLICTNVNAETQYTDYKFIGYTQERKENDEFYKYEQTKLNRFYKFVETNVQYVRESDPYNQKYIDMSDCRMGDLISTNKNLPYDNKTRVLTVKTESNFPTNRIELKKISNTSSIKKIEIYAKDTLIKSYEPQEINLPDIEITILETNLEELDIRFHYVSTANINLNVSIISDTDNKSLSRDITLESRYNRFSINALYSENYDNYIKDNSLMGQNESYYFKYKVKKYRVYDLEKEYYIDSESTYFEDYVYDEEESYESYKIYKRDKLPDKEEPDESFSEGATPEPPLNTEVNQEPEEDESIKKTENPVEELTTTKPVVKTTGKKKTKTTTKCIQNVSKNDKEEASEKENITIGEPYETVDNLSKTNLTEYKAKNSSSTCECKPKINSLTILGLVMIISSLIITGIHYYSVNHR